jgi:hypothetical protein
MGDRDRLERLIGIAGMLRLNSAALRNFPFKSNGTEDEHDDVHLSVGNPFVLAHLSCIAVLWTGGHLAGRRDLYRALLAANFCHWCRLSPILSQQSRLDWWRSAVSEGGTAINRGALVATNALIKSTLCSSRRALRPEGHDALSEGRRPRSPIASRGARRYVAGMALARHILRLLSAARRFGLRHPANTEPISIGSV